MRASTQDLLALQAARIAAAVVALVTLVDDVGDRRAEVDLGEQLAAFVDVRAHDRELGLRERRGLGKNRRGHSDVADVVQQRGDTQRVLTFAVEPGFAAERNSQRSEATRGAGGVRIVPLDHAHHRIDHALHGHVGPLQRAERRGMRALRLQHAPNAVGERRQSSLIVFAVARFAIRDAQHCDRFVAGDHRHGKIALQIRQAVLLRLALRSLLEVACRARTHSVNRPARASGRGSASTIVAIGWLRSRQAASAIVLRGGSTKYM